MTTEVDKAKLGADTLQEFFKQFEESEIAQSVIGILLEELMNAKVISVSSESQQTGDQSNHGSEKSIDSDISLDVTGIIATSNNLAESNSEINSGEQNAVRTVGGDGRELQRPARSFEGQRVY